MTLPDQKRKRPNKKLMVIVRREAAAVRGNLVFHQEELLKASL